MSGGCSFQNGETKKGKQICREDKCNKCNPLATINPGTQKNLKVVSTHISDVLFIKLWLTPEENQCE